MKPEYKLISSKRFENSNIERYTLNYFVLKLLVIYALCIAAAFILCNGLWSSNAGFAHTLSEAFCIFTAFSAFITTWSIYDSNALADKVIGFGLLAVTVFDMLHAYYYPILKLYPDGYFDLSTRFWILGRLTEGIIFFLGTNKLMKKGIGRNAALISTLTISVGVSFLVVAFPGSMPVLLVPPFTMTVPKLVLEYLVIALFVITLFNLRKSHKNRNLITNSYMLMVLLLAIPSEICFTAFKDYDSFFNVFGHMLRISYYFCMFRGIFVSAVIYPNNQMKEYNARINELGDFTYSLLDGLPAAFMYYNGQMRLAFVNKKTAEMIGYSPEELDGLTIFDIMELLCGKDSEHAAEHINRVIRSEMGQSINMTAGINTKEGARLNVAIETYKLANGDIVSFFTEAKEEQSLKNLRLQTQMILNSTGKMAIVTDSDNNIIMCNKTFMDIFELESPVTGRSVLEIADMFEIEIEKKNTARSSAGGKKEFRAAFSSKNGQRKELLINISDINDLEGSNLGRIIIGTDVTDMSKDQVRVRQQEKLAMIGQMAAGIVHEIKNPLAAIKGFSQLIGAKSTENRIREYASAINDSINDLNKVVSDFLKFAKPVPSVMKAVSLNELLKSLELMISTHAYNKGVSCLYSYAPCEMPVKADEGQIKQVILNVVENAIDAMSDTTAPLLRISTELNSGTGEMILKIADNGKGMTPEEKLKVGTPFYTTKEKGTGLGTSICYQIVSDHGGIMEIESEPDKGTAIIITLPCGREE